MQIVCANMYINLARTIKSLELGIMEITNQIETESRTVIEKGLQSNYFMVAAAAQTSVISPNGTGISL